jgi:hypothetical protein
MGYSEAQKRAIMRYKLKNRERINEQARLDTNASKRIPTATASDLTVCVSATNATVNLNWQNTLLSSFARTHRKN